MLKRLSPSQIDIPLRRNFFYRFFEIVPGFCSLTVVLLMPILSLINSSWAAFYVLFVICLVFVRGLAVLVNSWLGYWTLKQSMLVDWQQRLADLEQNTVFHQDGKEYGFSEHLKRIETFKLDSLAIRPSQVYHLIIIAAYNETLEVLEPTIQSLQNSSYDQQKFIICLAYEERGGAAMERTARALREKYQRMFYDFVIIKHPSNQPDEVIGKGSNISFAGRKMSHYLRQNGIDSSLVVVTTLDSDNRPHHLYFNSVTYEFVTRLDRQHLSFQPVALFLNNIWDTTAPIRVSSAGDSIWNTVLTVRSHKLRNFAAHSQPLLALEKMDFWSTRTVVEDGHQYWRSFFFFKGDYDVVPIRLPIYQDAVLSSSYRKTLTDRFVQVRRWAYGASDIPYVANMIRRHWRVLPLAEAIFKFFDLLDGHITWAAATIVVLLGGWLPAIFSRGDNVVAHQLPSTISNIQTIAMLGIISTVVIFFRFLPLRPKRYGRMRLVLMWLQWLTFPITTVFYGSLAAFYAQIRLMFGRYLTKFDVTNKNTVIKD